MFFIRIRYVIYRADGTRVQHVFLSLAPVVCFPALGACCMLSLSWHRWHIFPRRLHVFPLLQRLHAIPFLTPVACLHAFVTGNMFSRALHRSVDECFSALGTFLSSHASHLSLSVFPRLAPFACFFPSL